MALRASAAGGIMDREWLARSPAPDDPPWRRAKPQGEGAMKIMSINPATDEILETFEQTDATEIERILERSRAVFLEWRDTSFSRRTACMVEAGRLLRARKADHARTMTLEMGKPIAQSEAELE